MEEKIGWDYIMFYLSILNNKNWDSFRHKKKEMKIKIYKNTQIKEVR